jgi:alpha-tubulin suppressor-like RCC1 family protein
VKSLVATATEGPGANCIYGGKKITSGLDANGNGTLDTAEVQATSYVCNGVKPVAAPINNTPAVQVSTGQTHTCATLSDGTAWCWSDNFFGELGIGNATGPSVCDDGNPCALAAMQVHGVGNSGVLTGVKKVVASSNFSCALLTNGTVACWGLNAYGTLGVTSTGQQCASTTCSTFPLLISGVTGATEIAAGQNHVCALVAGGAVKCWGENGSGQLGNGTNVGNASCGWTSSCNVTPTAVKGVGGTGSLSGVSAIASGHSASHTCVVLSNGSPACWGYNASGQLGVGGSSGPSLCWGSPCAMTPTAVSLTGVAAIAADQSNSCALISDGTMQCWGSNFSGQLGIDQVANETCFNGDECATTPGAVKALAGVTAISVGGNEVCALLSGGTASCWGSNDVGKLGIGLDSLAGFPIVTEAKAPQAVVNLAGATSISVGSSSVCAVADGLVECWGGNQDGALGNGTSSVGSPSPVVAAH